METLIAKLLQDFEQGKMNRRQLISSLMNGSETNEGGPAPVYVFSGEKRRLHITVLRGTASIAG